MKSSPEIRESLKEESKGEQQKTETLDKIFKADSSFGQEIMSAIPPIKTKKKQRSSRSKNLALRADVMNKNIFRAFRRECKTVFQNFLLSSGFTISRSKRIFSANLRRFSSYLLHQTNILLQSRPEFDTEEYMKYVGIFLNLCSMKKIFTSRGDLNKIESFNELLYSYSHKKFKDFLTIPEVSVLLRVIFEKEGVEEFVRKHNTLVVNQESYVSHIKELLKNI
jgi:hypothetical protein